MDTASSGQDEATSDVEENLGWSFAIISISLDPLVIASGQGRGIYLTQECEADDKLDLFDKQQAWGRGIHGC